MGRTARLPCQTVGDTLDASQFGAARLTVIHGLVPAGGRRPVK